MWGAPYDLSPNVPSVGVTVPPTFEPVTLDEYKADRGLEVDTQDADIDRRLVTARGYVEQYTGRVCCLQTIALGLDRFPYRRGGEIRVPRPPLVDLVSFTYVDINGVTQALAPTAYQVDTRYAAEPGRILPAWNTCWPSTRRVPGAVQLTFHAGAASRGAVSQAMRSAIILLTADTFEQREITVLGTIVDQLPWFRDLLANDVVSGEFDYR